MYLYLAGRAYLAAHLASIPNSSHLKRAVELESSNAEYHDRLGRSLVFSGQNLDQAISAYKTAVRLNPYRAQYWLDLAGAYLEAGRSSDQAKAIEGAEQAAPTEPHVVWESANYHLLQGDRDEALRRLGVVLANDPESVDAVIQLCWRATGGEKQIYEILPPRAEVYLSFLRFLINKKQTAAAEDVWSRLVSLNQSFRPRLVFPYFRFLLEQHEVEAARSAWVQLADLDPSLRAYLPSPQNLIVNGRFEKDVLNGGFDWWYVPRPHTTTVLDGTESHSGARSISIGFDGHSSVGGGIAHFVPVRPNTKYEFSVEYKTEQIESASGPRFAIVDAYTDVSYLVTDDFLGTNPWRLERAEFQTGPDTSLVVIQIVREPATSLIRGKLWVDDFKLVEK
jgi:hypothetical protein